VSAREKIAEAIWRADRSHEADCCKFEDCQFPNYYRGLPDAA
jgi:hypothetical protein